MNSEASYLTNLRKANYLCPFFSMRGTNMMLGNVTVLLLANNSIENVCGLERLYSLKKLDLTSNKIKELCDVSALAKLPNLMELNMKGNPIVKRGEN